MVTFVIVGRPNVGKSTLFNRMAGRRVAIVADCPGVTRDRQERDVVWCGLSFRLVDTAGLSTSDSASLEGRMHAQTENAICMADVCLFLFDARAGVSPVDAHFAKILHKWGKQTVLVANKCEGRAGEAGLMEAFSLGFGAPLAISAEQGDGMVDLSCVLRSCICDLESGGLVNEGNERGDCEEPDVGPEVQAESCEPTEKQMRIAIVGRPNVGKSTLVNRLVDEERLLTGVEAGITRDAIQIPWIWSGRQVLLHDTAGLRRKAKIDEQIERASVSSALSAVQFSDVSILLVDCENPFEKQDLRIANLILESGRAIVIAVNKWDRVGREGATVIRRLRKDAERLLPQVRGVSLVPVSARTGFGLGHLMRSVFFSSEIWGKRIPTSLLNRFLADAILHNPPPSVSGRRIRLRYMTQPRTRPPTFVLFSQRAEQLPEAYMRYLVNRLRESFTLQGTPIRLYVRRIRNPYTS